MPITQSPKGIHYGRMDLVDRFGTQCGISGFSPECLDINWPENALLDNEIKRCIEIIPKVLSEFGRTVVVGDVQRQAIGPELAIRAQ